MDIQVSQHESKVVLTLYRLEAAFLRELIKLALERPGKEAESDVVGTKIIIKEDE